MKLATYRDGSRDGQLVVVSRDLALAHYASGIATRLQQVLDDWNFLSPQLEDLSLTLNQGKARHAFPFEPAMCMAPLPRAYRHERDAGLHAPSDDFSGACDDIAWPGDALRLDAQAALAAICGDIDAGATPESALEGIRLLMLTQTIIGSADGAAPFELMTACAPVAVTPDELGGAWQGGCLLLDIRSTRNGKRQSRPAATPEAPFGARISASLRRRGLRAGAIVASALQIDAATAEPLQAGDELRIEIVGPDGTHVFGTIDQRVEGPTGAAG
ncbi:MAG: fumarylacetoacetate hydrolase family protein [Proteobacteria bacterium]|nr:fumarylacetoacetate hydrolase family protein [Pseudomonadota bacterium]